MYLYAVKNAAKYFVQILLLSIYCYTLVLVSNSKYIHAFHENLEDAKQKYSITASSTIFWHTSETSDNLQNKLPVPSLKNLLDKDIAINRTEEQICGKGLSTWRHSFIIFFINQQNSKLLFPFHSFW